MESSHINNTIIKPNQVYALLARIYRINDLGNKRNPLDELAYILLSGQTSETKYQKTYKAFKRAFPKWGDILKESPNHIRKSINSGGLAKQKSKYLKSIVMKIKSDFGEVSLRKLKIKSDTEAEQYLLSLPGVGIKTARCILMYSLDRMVFPADVHCLRIMDRLGWIEWKGETNIKIADYAQSCIPPRIRKRLHILFVHHGRTVCKPSPKCHVCVLRSICDWTKGK